MGQTLENNSPGGRKYTDFVNAEIEIVFFFGFIISYFFYFTLCIYDGGLQKRQVIVTSLGGCCRHSGRVPHSPDFWSSCNVRGKMREEEVDDDKGMVNDVQGVQNLGGRDVKLDEGRDFCLCDGVGVDGSGGSVRVDDGGGSGLFWSGGGGMFGSGRHFYVGWGFCGGCG